jgi:hypothetical protein
MLLRGRPGEISNDDLLLGVARELIGSQVQRQVTGSRRNNKGLAKGAGHNP